MANVLGELFQNIADAIRSKTGSTDTLKPNEFPAAIEGITTGGGSSADVRYVTFRNESTGEEYKKAVAVGDDCVDVVAKGLWKTPTKESTAQYNYTYYGWGASDGGAADANILKNITEDKTVYAIFTATVRYYTITWLDSDGVTELPGQKQWAYGTVPSYTPTKSGAMFNGWTPTPTEVTGDANYTAAWIEVQGNGTIEDGLTWVLDNSGVLIISGTGATPDYIYKTVPWNDLKEGITKVVIGAGVTGLGNNTLASIPNLTMISVETGNEYFSTNSAGILFDKNKTTIVQVPATFTSVTIPSTVTAIGNYSFCGCTGLISITIPATVKQIGLRAFKNSGLTSVTFKDTSGWYCKSGGSSAIKYPALDATNLTTKYVDYYWYDQS